MSTPRCILVAALMAAMLAGVGCATEDKPVFSPLREPVVWPAPPEKPRIAYVGELVGEASLHRKKAGGEVLRELVTGPTPTVGFATPLAVAAEGDVVYVADPASALGPAVLVLNLETRAFSSITEAGGAALQWPIDVAASHGRLAIADAKRGAVFVASGPNHAAATIGRGVLQRPAAVAWSPDGRELWVLDAGAHALVVFDASGALRYSLGGHGNAAGLFNYPAGLCLAGGATSRELPTVGPPAAGSSDLRAIVADAMNFRVQVLDVAGQPLLAFGRKGDAAGDFSLPRDVATDRDGHIYVLDNQFENVQIFDPGGRLLMALGGEGSGPGQFSLPSGISIDDRDRIWVADTYNRRVQVFQYLRETQP